MIGRRACLGGAQRRISSVCLVAAVLGSLSGVSEGRTLRAGRDAGSITATLAMAADGDTVIVPGGTWREHLTIEKRVTLLGEGLAVLDGDGRGTPLRIGAAGAIVRGLSVRNGGRDLGANDACIYLEKTAKGATVQRCQVNRCAFGIYVDRTVGARIADNRVVGATTGHRSNRGNGIHLFDASKLEIANNHISGGRDGIYVSATEDSRFLGNRVEGGRYCVHYMFSYRNHLIGNRCNHNAHGYALMESRHIVVKDNHAVGNEGQGLLFRDAEECTISGNTLARNGIGIFFYSSIENIVSGNLIANNEIGAKIWAGSQNNQVFNNDFIGNKQPVFYVGSSDLVWGRDRSGNHYSDYLGWDHDGDGVGERPYRVSSFSVRLIAQYPAAALLLNSPGLELLSLLEARMPLLRVPTVVDRAPRIRRSTSRRDD
ncbi:MAG: nitrous oxide reductase family maturation protein NosD [Deltaproteobacteria bacterium]|nr:nitrous oxide reductase family maturation protein NosD [Deltaproteobacteria bacterium]